MKVGKEINKIVLFVEGGIGKNIMATAVVRAIKKQYPEKKIIVVAGCVDVFLHNPNVHRVYNFQNPLYFFEDNVDPHTMIFRTEPYMHPDYIGKKKHLVECWCEMFGVKPDGYKPDIFLIPNEIDNAEKHKAEITKGKPLLLLQWTGGKTPKDNSETQHKEALASMYRRSITKELAQDLVNSLKKKYTIGVIGDPKFPKLDDTQVVCHTFRNTLSLIHVADKFIGIDSFAQHARAAFDKKSLILWGGTSPACLGYDLHTNLTKEACTMPFCHRPNSYLLDIQANGMMWDCPYGEKCLSYTKDEILAAFKKEK